MTADLISSYATLPLADPSLRVTSTVTSLDVSLLSVMIPVSDVLLSASM